MFALQIWFDKLQGHPTHGAAIHPSQCLSPCWCHGLVMRKLTAEFAGIWPSWVSKSWNLTITVMVFSNAEESHVLFRNWHGLLIAYWLIDVDDHSILSRDPWFSNKSCSCFFGDFDSGPGRREKYEQAPPSAVTRDVGGSRVHARLEEKFVKMRQLPKSIQCPTANWLTLRWAVSWRMRTATKATDTHGQWAGTG